MWMKKVYDKVCDILVIYCLVCFAVVVGRISPMLAKQEMDCEKRNVDKFLIFARLHCPIDEEKQIKIELPKREAIKSEIKSQAVMKYFPKEK